MPRTQYRTTFIEIQNDHPAYLNKVVAHLDQLAALTLGAHLLAEIAKRVVIQPPPAGQANSCITAGDTHFYRLRAAFRGAGGYSIATELTHALLGAAMGGWNVEKIAKSLVGGMSPVSLRTIGNLQGGALMTQAARERVEGAIADDIRTAAFGQLPPGHALRNFPRGVRTLGDDLLRFLRPWLRPGDGNASAIRFNPDIELGCMGDKMKKRPPAIGLAHELCHAWRNSVGQRLFDDAVSCGLDDDEVMTTGFPPYQFEKYSENLFRAEWPSHLPMRVNYR